MTFLPDPEGQKRPQPKKLLGRVQKVNKGPNCGQIKNKEGALLSHNQSCNSSLFQSKLFRVCQCPSHVYIFF